MVNCVGVMFRVIVVTHCIAGVVLNILWFIVIPLVRKLTNLLLLILSVELPLFC